MTTSRWIAGALAALALVSGAALGLQRQEADVLRGEIAFLREERGELGRLRTENKRLAAAQAPASEVEQLRADHAAIARLRTEIEQLRTTTEATARRVQGVPGAK